MLKPDGHWTLKAANAAPGDTQEGGEDGNKSPVIAMANHLPLRGLGFRGLGFIGFRVSGLRGLGYRVLSFILTRFRIQDSRRRVESFGFRDNWDTG